MGGRLLGWQSFGADMRYGPVNARIGEGPIAALAEAGVISASGNILIDGMLSGLYWVNPSLTFSFPTDPNFYEGSGGYLDGDEQDNNFEALSPQQQAVVTALLSQIAGVTGLSFALVTETDSVHGDLRFAMSDAAETAYAYLPSSGEWGGDSWYNNSTGNFDLPVLGSYAYFSMLHEIGHALGFDHPFDPNVYGAIPLGWDSTEYTVMTYRSALGSDLAGYTHAEFSFPQSLMMLDIQALQYMYGADYTFNATDTVYSWSPTTGEMFINGVGQGAPGSNTIFLTIWDGGGVDTYDFFAYDTQDLIIDLEPGYVSRTITAQLAVLDQFNNIRASGNIYNALLFNGDTRSLIENAIGGEGDDIFYGNSANNVLIGNRGADYFVADLGADTYYGMTSEFTDVDVDIVSYELSPTLVVINRETGVNTGAFAVGDTYVHVEGIAGSLFNDTLTGGSHLFGLDGNDTLDGRAGDDYLDGGAGDDTLLHSDGDDDFIGGSGIDTVTYAAATSGIYIDLLLHETGSGPAFGDTFSGVEIIIGTGFTDALIGDGAANTFYGGAGNDNLIGNGGNDILNPGTGVDMVNGGAGDDIVSYAGVSFSIGITYFMTQPAFNSSEVANDTLTSIEGIIGTSAGDRLEMNNSANFIDGGGGDDSLRGFGGNDTIYGGTGADNINGGADQDMIDGGDGIDTIDGSSGNDTIWGGAGVDFISGGSGIDASAYTVASTTATWARNSDGTWTVTTAQGAETLTSIETLQFSDRSVFVERAEQNFFGDATSDILLRRADGVTAIWNMNGATVANSNVTQWQAGNEWAIEGLGDFNSDGRDDFLLRRVSDGVTSIWSMNGTSVIHADVTLWQAGLEWVIQGIGDFDGDGRDDFLWRRNTDGVMSVWQMNSTNVAHADVTSQQAGLEWNVAGVGDFNGDARDDILLRRADGVTAIWQMNGTSVSGADITSQQAGNDWTIAGVGDFNGDGRDDLLLRHESGYSAVWTMNGTSVQSAAATSWQAGLEWSFVGIGDFNGDGREDILLRNASGVTSIWNMNGATVDSGNVTSQQTGLEWGII